MDRATNDVYVWDGDKLIDVRGKEYNVIEEIRDKNDNIKSFIVEKGEI